MLQVLTLDQLSESTATPPRRLRYVLDQGLLPGGKIASRGRGAVRAFTPFECFGIVVAVAMLEAGLKRALIRDGLALLCRRPPGADHRDVPLFLAWSADRAAILEVGDWTHVRVSGSSTSGTAKEFNTGWLPLDGGGPADRGYNPLISIRIDGHQLRCKIARR